MKKTPDTRNPKRSNPITTPVRTLAPRELADVIGGCESCHVPHLEGTDCPQ